MTTTNSSGWQLTLTHPTTGRSVSPDVLDDPEFLPSLNGLVEARIPIRRSQDLLEWPDATTVSLTLDGTDQPLDEVVDFEQESDRTIVVAEGGIELDNRVRTEYQKESRDVAASEVITNNTSYSTDIDTPTFETQTDVLLQSADTTQEFEDITQIQATTPVSIENGVVKTQQTAFVVEGESIFPQSTTTGGGDFSSADEWSGGEAAVLTGSVDDFSYTFTTEYDIPQGDLSLYTRGESSTSTTGGVFSIRLDGDLVLDDVTLPASSLSWDQAITLNPDGVLPAGEHTVEGFIDTLPPGDNVDARVDVVAVVDDRYNYTFDNSVNTAGGYLDGPEEKPNAVDVEFVDATTAFVITEATASIVIDDTTNEQAIALSTDRGDTYIEVINGDTLTATGLSTPQVRLRVTLSRYADSGPRNQTPRLGYSSQSVYSFEITANLRQETLLIDQTFDDSVRNVLNQIAGDEYVWSYRLENGTPTIAWTQPGQRTADSDPDIDADVSVSKNVKTWDAVTIKGSAQTVSAEEFDGSTSFVGLTRDNIVPGSEAVREPDVESDFRRSEDYEMQYLTGDIRILDSGDMSVGTTYEIDYRYEVEGQFPQEYSGGGRELVETISGVVSDRQATQLANTILNIDPAIAEPAYSANVLLPRGGALFDPLEALSLDQLGLPDAATPLEIREPPQQTPRGIALRLGTRRGLDDALSSLSSQLKSVSRRS